MVDLVKIRKKAKKAAESSSEPGIESSTDVPPPAAVGQEPQTQPSLDHSITGSLDHSPQPSKLEKFKQEAGKRRENETFAAEETTAAQLELLTFVMAREHYAVDIERIVEIVTPRAVTRIPNADTSVVGIMSLRGTIVTLVDVRRKLRHPAAGDSDADTRIVVVDFHNEMVGFVVDRVLRVVKTAATDVEPHPVVHATELDESIRGVFRVNDALTILLDLDKLLDSRALAASSA
jgi:purine-binding chemotaxis protein CheW